MKAAAKVREAERTYSITDLAQEFDLTTRAIRFYEDKGLRRINVQYSIGIIYGSGSIIFKLTFAQYIVQM